MSEENVEIVRRAYAAVTATLELSAEIFDRNFVADGSDVAAGVLRGRAAAQAALGEYWRTFEGFHVEIEEVIHADREKVVTAVRDGGKMKGSETEVWNRLFRVWTVAYGKIVRFLVHTNRDGALEAAGLSE